VLDVPALDAEPRQIVEGLSAVALEENAALEELVHGLMPLRLLSRRLLSSETFRIIAAAVPGILEAALLARIVAWLEERDRRGRHRFDVVVLDSPASGHSVPLLATPRTLSGLATVGPLGSVMRRTSRWLSDPALTRALVVAPRGLGDRAGAVELHLAARRAADSRRPPGAECGLPRRFSRADEGAAAPDRGEPCRRPGAARGGSLRFVERRNVGQAHARAARCDARVRPAAVSVFSASMTWEDLGPLADALDPCWSRRDVERTVRHRARPARTRRWVERRRLPRARRRRQDHDSGSDRGRGRARRQARRRAHRRPCRASQGRARACRSIRQAAPRACYRKARPARWTRSCLDAKGIFDGLVRRLSPTPALANRVLANPVYRNVVAGAFAGSDAYMALEQLLDIVAAGTSISSSSTPRRRATRSELFDAPERILALLDCARSSGPRRAGADPRRRVVAHRARPPLGRVERPRGA
jgi:hypothetical protein